MYPGIRTDRRDHNVPPTSLQQKVLLSLKFENNKTKLDRAVDAKKLETKLTIEKGKLLQKDVELNNAKGQLRKKPNDQLDITEITEESEEVHEENNKLIKKVEKLKKDMKNKDAEIQKLK